MARNEMPWLVKSSGRILGPYTSDKVGDLLRSREISMLDEISVPGRRWQTIQYIDVFRDVIDSLRKANLSERTEANWTQQTNLTQTLTDVDGATLTEELSNSGFTATAKEIVVHDVREEQTSLYSPGGQGRYQPQHGQNTAIERQVEKTTRSLWIVTVLVLLAAAGFIARKRFMPTPNLETRVGGQTIKQTVLNLIQIGHYGEALRELKSGVPDSAPVSDMSLYYGSLLIQVEGQTVLGRRWLNGVLTAKRPEAKQAWTGLGLADLVDGQLDQAADKLGRALAMDADYVPAIVNLAIVSLKRGEFVKARELSSRALRLSPFQGEAVLALAEATLYLYKREPGTDVVSLGRTMKRYLAGQWDYWGEVGFYDLFFEQLRRDPNVDEHLRNYLDRDPQLTTDHRHNVFIYRGRAQWNVLGRLCEQMGEQLGSTASSAALLASCYAREARWDAARTAIERAVRQAPKDPLIQAWYSYILRESGDADQASVVLGRATEFNRREAFILPSLLQARFCQLAGVVECARSWWQKIYERDLEYLPAIAGLAWTQSQSGSKSEAASLVVKGLKISPDYIPLLELKAKAEADGSYLPTN